jgi:hypothetical protein
MAEVISYRLLEPTWGYLLGTVVVGSLSEGNEGESGYVTASE